MFELKENRIIFVYMIILAVFSSECDGQKEGDPIKFACITIESQSEFYIGEVNGSIPSTLVDQLHNGKAISLFFHGVSSLEDILHGYFYNYAKEWFKASGNNICIVSCTYEISRKSFPAEMIDLMTGWWLEYVAKMASDFLLAVSNQIEIKPMIDLIGFGFGAHIAGRTCNYLSKQDKKVRSLLALDPIKTKIEDTIKREYANYVQVIHTSKKVGIWYEIGHVDVYVKYEKETHLGAFNDEHGIAFFIHIATSTKRLFVTVDSKQKGNGTMFQRDATFVEPVLGQNECEVGVYGTHESIDKYNGNEGGKAYLSLKKRNSMFWGAIGSFAKVGIFLKSQEVDKQETKAGDKVDDKCPTCVKKKKNCTLLPCNHKYMCYTCWRKWRIHAPSSTPTCPVCRQVVTDVKKDKECCGCV